MKFIEKNWLWLAIAAIAVWWFFLRKQPATPTATVRNLSTMSGADLLQMIRTEGPVPMSQVTFNGASSPLISRQL